jgi:hypothetical protein
VNKQEAHHRWIPHIVQERLGVFYTNNQVRLAKHSITEADGSVTNSVAEVAEVLLDKHFPGSTLEQEHSNDIPDIGIEVNFDHETLSFIDTTKLKQAIEQFGPHKANGPDGLKPIVLQNLPASTLEAIVKLFKVSIAIGATPKTWTRSKVIFLPKPGKDSYAEAGSFRVQTHQPVLLLPQIT